MIRSFFDILVFLFDVVYDYLLVVVLSFVLLAWCLRIALVLLVCCSGLGCFVVCSDFDCCADCVWMFTSWCLDLVGCVKCGCVLFGWCLVVVCLGFGVCCFLGCVVVDCWFAVICLLVVNWFVV